MGHNKLRMGKSFTQAGRTYETTGLKLGDKRLASVRRFSGSIPETTSWCSVKIVYESKGLTQFELRLGLTLMTMIGRESLTRVAAS